jgi:hypothetical protein
LQHPRQTPIAIPKSTGARAGASLTPSPHKRDAALLRLQLLDSRRFHIGCNTSPCIRQPKPFSDNGGCLGSWFIAERQQAG